MILITDFATTIICIYFPLSLSKHLFGTTLSIFVEIFKSLTEHFFLGLYDQNVQWCSLIEHSKGCLQFQIKKYEPYRSETIFYCLM